MTSLDERDDPIAEKELPTLRDALDSLQGNILCGHGRDHSVHVLLRFLPGHEGSAKTWIAKIAQEHITSAQQQLEEAKEHQESGVSGKVFYSFLLSARGYEALHIPYIPEDKAFRQGMSARRALSGTNVALNDPPMHEWEPAYQKKIHAMLLLACADEDVLLEALRSCMMGVEEFAEIRAFENGRVRRNADHQSIEHFGYVDGLNQLLFFKNDSRQENTQKRGTDAGTNLVLVKDPNGGPDAYGSYLVFRKLEQDVDGFEAGLKALANILNLTGADRQRAEALVMGRFRNGTPLVLQSTPGMSNPIPNDFTFSKDPQGVKCPFQAHIRKMNPRGERDRVVQSALAATLKRFALGGQEEYDAMPSALAAEYSERRRRIARRSVLYGIHKKEQEQDSRLVATSEVGVLFMCYQKNISRQFEFLQASWANNEHAPAQDTAPDAIIGRVGAGQQAIEQKWPRRWNGMGSDCENFSFPSFVTLKGGEYFFAPSLPFLRNIEAIATSSGSV